MARTESTPQPLATLAVLVLMLVGGVLSLRLTLQNPNLGSDSLGYLLPIHNWLAGQGYVLQDGLPMLHFPPGYGLLALPFSWLVKDVALAGSLASGLAYVLCIALAHRVGSLLFSQTAGLLAAFLVTFSPAFLSASYQTLSEASYAFFLLAALYSHLRLTLFRPGWGRAALTGGLLGYAYLIRPEAMLPALLLLGSHFVLGYRAGPGPAEPGRRTFERRPGLALLSLAVFLALAGPYLYHLRVNLGHWAISAKTAEVFMRAGNMATRDKDYLDRSKVPEKSQNSLTGLAAYARENAGELLLRVKSNIVTTLTGLARLLLPALAPLFLIWLLLPLRQTSPRQRPRTRAPDRGRVWLTWAIFLSPLPVIIWLLVLDRYLVPYAVLLLIALAAFLDRLLTRLDLPSPLLGLAGVMLAGLLVSSSLTAWFFGRLSLFLANPPEPLGKVMAQEHHNLSLRKAGIWLNGHLGSPPPGKVTVWVPRKGRVLVFYANGQRLEGPVRTRDIGPDNALEEVAESLRRGETDYLVLERHYSQSRPAFHELYKNPELARPLGLTLLRQGGADGYAVFVAEAAAAARPPAPAEAAPPAPPAPGQ